MESVCGLCGIELNWRVRRVAPKSQRWETFARDFSTLQRIEPSAGSNFCDFSSYFHPQNPQHIEIFIEENRKKAIFEQLGRECVCAKRHFVCSPLHGRKSPKEFVERNELKLTSVAVSIEFSLC